MANKKYKLTQLAILVAMASSGTVAAEEAPVVEEKTTLTKKEQREKVKDETEVIVVTGIRDSLAQALSLKQHADFGMDVISSEDIGKLPDIEVGDVIERIAGVQVSRGDDGIVQGISIRGLPGNWNRVLYNDRVITSSLSAQRSFDSQVMPAAFMKRVEVHKTAVSNVNEGGLAGVVNLRSIRAFDIGKRAARFNVGLGSPENVDDINTDILGIYSDLYLDDTLGFTFGVSHTKSDNEIQRSEGWHPTAAGSDFTNNNGTPDDSTDDFLERDWNGNGIEDVGQSYHFGALTTYALEQNHRERNAFFTNLEWRPNDNLKVFGEIFHTDYKRDDNRSYLQLRTGGSSPTTGEGAKVFEGFEGENDDGSTFTRNYLTAFQTSDAWINVRNAYNQRESNVSVAFLDVEWLQDAWTFKFGMSASNSKTNQFQVQSWAEMADPDNRLNILIDSSDPNKPRGITFNNPDNDPDYSARLLGNHPTSPMTSLSINVPHLDGEVESNSWSLNFDGEYYFDMDNPVLNPTRLLFGLRYAEDETLAIVSYGNFDSNISGLPGYDNASYKMVFPSRGTWFDGGSGQSNVPLPFAVPDAKALVEQNNWTPELLKTELENVGRYNPGTHDDIKEDIGAAYVRLDVESASGDLKANFGLRYVHTQQFVRGSGISQIIDRGIGDPSDEDYFSTDWEATPEDDITHKRNYYHYLPSVNFRYMLAEELYLRGAWSQTMTRPLPRDLKLQQSFSAPGEQSLPSINTPDPDLDVMKSENVDLALEWYYAEASALTLALFYKDIDNLPVDSYGVTNKIPVFHEYTAANYDENPDIEIVGKFNDAGTIVQGATVIFEQPFTALPSFLSNTGMKVNYTYLEESNTDYELGLAKDNLSTTLYYDGKSFDARLSYNYKSAGGYDSQRNNVASVGSDAYGYMSASLSYKYNQNIHLGLSLRNLTNEVVGQHYEHGANRKFVDAGRSINFSIRTRL